VGSILGVLVTLGLAEIETKGSSEFDMVGSGVLLSDGSKVAEPLISGLAEMVLDIVKDGVSSGLMDSVNAAVGVGLSVMNKVADGLSVKDAVGVGLLVGESVGVGLLVGESVGVGVLVGDAVGVVETLICKVGEGDGVPVMGSPLALAS